MKCCYIILIVNVLVSCKKNSQAVFDQKLIGSWRYVYSKGGFIANLIVLPPAGTTTILLLNKNKSYQLKLNGQIQEQGNYQVGQIQSLFTTKNDNGIKFDNSSDWKIISVQDDTLSITDNHVEPITIKYVKAN